MRWLSQYVHHTHCDSPLWQAFTGPLRVKDARKLCRSATVAMIEITTLQVLFLVETNMQSQVRYEYNNTALPRNATNSSVLRTTAFWDAMQIKVLSPSNNSNFISVRLRIMDNISTSTSLCAAINTLNNEYFKKMLCSADCCSGLYCELGQFLLNISQYTVFRKKTPTHVFFYISVENV